MIQWLLQSHTLTCTPTLQHTHSHAPNIHTHTYMHPYTHTHPDTHMHTHTHTHLYINSLSNFFPYSVLSRESCTLQYVLVGYILHTILYIYCTKYILYIFFIYSSTLYVNPKLLIYSSLPRFPFGNHKFVFYICESASGRMFSPLCLKP